MEDIEKVGTRPNRRKPEFRLLKLSGLKQLALTVWIFMESDRRLNVNV